MIEEYKAKVEAGYNLTIEDCEKIMRYRRKKGEGYNAGNKIVNENLA